MILDSAGLAETESAKGENLFHFKLWRNFILSVEIHNLDLLPCFEAVKVGVDGLLRND